MGFFDSLAAQAESALSSAIEDSHPGMLEHVTELVGGGNLQSLVSSFKENGLGDAVASWIGTGHNLPITAEQLQTVLGSEQVQAIAEKMGLPLDVASESLATLLPQVIDKLSPNGELPENHLVEQGLALLKSFG